MATTEELLARQAALEDALASGQSEVRYGQMYVSYRSALEIKQALADVRRELRGAPPVTEIRFSTSKGLGT